MAATRLHHCAAWEAGKGWTLGRRRRKCEACDKRIVVLSLRGLRKRVAISADGTASCTATLEHLFVPSLYDGWAPRVGWRVRDPERASKLGGAGHDFAWCETLGVPLMAIFCVQTPPFGSFEAPWRSQKPTNQSLLLA